jgi:type VI secretion system VasD/TssJ family lipoprotein
MTVDHIRASTRFFLARPLGCCLIAAHALAAGCSMVEKAKPDKRPCVKVRWSFERKAIKVVLRADARLNYRDRQAHALMLCFYQMEKADSFYKLAETREGLKKLLTCERYDPSALSVDRAFVTPKKTKTVWLDRAEKARRVGIVAGYYEMSPPQVTRVYTIPVAVRRTGWILKKTRYRPGLLTLDLKLGPQEMQPMSKKQRKRRKKRQKMCPCPPEETPGEAKQKDQGKQ